jgi:hypothetical protein
MIVCMIVEYSVNLFGTRAQVIDLLIMNLGGYLI